ncbi:uncharacterized protein LOC122565991 [Bombus pyrosoma]|uniref:uncharacterized protein LOC122565991 n=1 Tax=Bombus pyrosoma TaxID=396416 RepID=UPI001CB946BB|nr:uncharacterized protein LOC122565991 [Bombus pyrosoma]
MITSSMFNGCCVSPSTNGQAFSFLFLAEWPLRSSRSPRAFSFMTPWLRTSFHWPCGQPCDQSALQPWNFLYGLAPLHEFKKCMYIFDRYVVHMYFHAEEVGLEEENFFVRIV